MYVWNRKFLEQLQPRKSRNLLFALQQRLIYNWDPTISRVIKLKLGAVWLDENEFADKFRE